MTSMVAIDHASTPSRTTVDDNSEHNVPQHAGNSGYSIDRERARQLVTQLAQQLTHPLTPSSAPASCASRDLAELAALTVVRAITDELSNHAATAAAEHGMRYPAIAKAVGTTRQNARLRWPGLTAIARRAAAHVGTVTHREEGS